MYYIYGDYDQHVDHHAWRGETVMARKFHRSANPDLAAAMRELRRSSAAQRHTLKKYKGSRTANKRRAVADSMR
jgi:hypothetical protein